MEVCGTGCLAMQNWNRRKGEVQDKISLKKQANLLELGSTFIKFPNPSNLVPKTEAYLVNTLASWGKFHIWTVPMCI